ncbi:MAG: signal peptidase I [Cellulosilyticaceae bacterium]
MLISITILENSIFRGLPGDKTLYLISVFIWGMMIYVIYRYLPRLHGADKISIRQNMYWWSFNTSLVFILVNSLAGFWLGVGKSPYVHQLGGLLLNGAFIVTKIIGRESIRYYLINTFCRKRKGWKWWGIILIMVGTQFNFNVLGEIKDFEGLFRIMIKDVLPCFLQNILAMYWVKYGGVGASAIGLGVLVGFEWFSPLIPQFNWFLQSMLMLAEYFIAILITQQTYDKRRYDKHHRPIEAREWIKNTPIIIGCIFLIWFVVGVFSVYPKVILTGSMEPFIEPGDIILVKKFQIQEEIKILEVGDVIVFKREGKSISHRIIAVVHQEGKDLYETKGDANESADTKWVRPEDLQGKVIKVVPKLGLPSLWLKGEGEMRERSSS